MAILPYWKSGKNTVKKRICPALLWSRLVDGRQAGGGLMTVKDLSTSGLKIQINDSTQLYSRRCCSGLNLASMIAIEPLIKKKVIVRNIVGQNMGTEFAPTEAIDKALGFYLFS